MAWVKDYPPYLDRPKSMKPITNADRIRSKSDEELARFIYGLLANYENRERNTKYWLEWLKQPAEE